MRKLKFLFLLLALASPSYAATFRVPSDREMIEAAHSIVIGEVTSLYSTLDEKGEIVTKVVIAVSDVPKGPARTRVELTEPGGILGDRARGVSGSPSYYAGMKVVVLIDASGDPILVTQWAMLGKFQFVQATDGTMLLLRGHREEGVHGFDLEGAPHLERPRKAEAFVRYVRRVVAGESAPLDYWADERSRPRDPLPPHQPSTGMNSDSAVGSTTSQQTSAQSITIQPLATYPPSAYSMQGPARWSTFDAGGSVTFRTNGTQPGFDGIGAAQRGAAAWTNEPNSNVRYSVSGTTTGRFVRDGINSILFNSSSDVSPPTLGIGQWYASGQHTYQGETFFTVVEGDVVVGSNLGISQQVFDEMMTHELGHTLSFRHSDQGTPSSTAAVMKSILSGAYGASLGPWDIEAVTTMYSAPGSGGASGDPAQGRTTVVFTDDPLVAGVTIVRAIHINQLRQAVNEIRGRAGLPAYSFTDTIAPGVVVKAIHINELRTALDEARARLGLSTGGWTGTISPGVIIRAIHIQEIRNRMK
jgi:hypothetical protein